MIRLHGGFTGIVFEFMNDEVSGPWGPAVSSDGVGWKWLGPQSVLSKQSFKYNFSEGYSEIYFSFCIP